MLQRVREQSAKDENGSIAIRARLSCLPEERGELSSSACDGCESVLSMSISQSRARWRMLCKRGGDGTLAYGASNWAAPAVRVYGIA